jgi:hypothetical protein
MKENIMIDKYELKEVLQNSVVTVIFTKVDGTERKMNCTLLPEYIPQVVAEKQQLLTESLPKAENPNTIAVWDIESNGWRSFRLDSIKSVTKNETHIR